LHLIVRTRRQHNTRLLLLCHDSHNSLLLHLHPSLAALNFNVQIPQPQQRQSFLLRISGHFALEEPHLLA
jgi:hypothetical protein